ncbi:uncharacterized protein STEHIDRAFT_150711 [Stereum hirsutum FP-91666 SS1]|uniref:Uncharacterized protein n=1 Tax=Stereum hirsutum (strain FP-91666) TaxID=721885 RepID=R7S0N2_STEHR|nr:uncharacterized protein STEHIDRAFT_150711 [Stereum hirsutum FP-91666 SS1]EIM80107.1 hypothetical protein STEHIDRAFT_150711 [Stereum hirsutum FP-91666 SS1]
MFSNCQFVCSRYVSRIRCHGTGVSSYGRSRMSSRLSEHPRGTEGAVFTKNRQLGSDGTQDCVCCRRDW